MKKIIFLILLIITFNPLFSQTEKEKLFEKNIDSIMAELRFSYQYDQAMREYILFKTFDKSIIDSLETLDDPREYIFAHNFETNKVKRIWDEFIHPADDKFTELMIDISNKYGYPSLKRINKYYDGIVPPEFDPTILLIHSRKKYWSEINTMVEREFKNGNMGKCDYGYIKWHISGRKENSFLKENGIKFAAGDNGQVYYIDSCEDK
ncbi:hypothetical protein [Christiangramia sp. OXR-203]|uniref:hypothetical protein n=1 Tax=Christiangramia sp. OXR-203 TaxID=3100176 RepID=UPI002AC929D6|nr:hypothetical protein [Christiangramia sp. OXR-203]WPY97624.1 hypothetical protein T8I65_10605 [Christiangramia sp. OXR-203]